MTYNYWLDPELNDILQKTDLFLMKIKQQTKETDQ